jgi:phage terminase large subunit
MNRHVENDPVYEAFIGRSDCLHININFEDNPFCTDALKKEAEECLKKSPTDYDHIWLGQPLSQSEDALFSRAELLALKNTRVNCHPGFNMRIAGFDIARYGDDKCACVILQQMDMTHWEAVHIEQWDHRDLNYTTGRILQIAGDHKVEMSIIDEDGLGAGPLDSLKHGRGRNDFSGFRNNMISYEDNKSYVNPRTINAYKLKELVAKGYIYFDNEDLIKELCSLRYNYDNHQRRILVSKDKMRKEGVKSPNIADALIYVTSLIGEVRQQQERPYQCNQPRYSAEDDLFKIAGC